MNRLLILLVVAGLLSCRGKDANKNNVIAGNKDTTISNPNVVSQTERPGYEYLSDSVYSKQFFFFNKDNYELISKQMRENFKNRKYQNHFLYCLDTISDYHAFVCCSAEYFETLCPIAWGFFFTDCEECAKDKIATQEFEIIKYNTIHGASLIVNSRLFDNVIPYGENPDKYQDDEFFLMKKYYNPYWDKEKLSDSLMNNMLSDIERLCVKYHISLLWK